MEISISNQWDLPLATENLSSLRCVVLGASGFIGTNLCRSLVGQVYSVRAFGRRQSLPRALHGCEWMQGDFGNPACLHAAVADCDVVFHLVSTTTPASANAEKLVDLNENVAGTLHLLEACWAASVQRIIFVSSGGTIYGIPERLPISESSQTNPITAYGISKLAIEKYLALFEYFNGLEYRVLRLANPFGPHQTGLSNQGVIGAFLRRALAGKPVQMWGDGSVIRDYIYIDDVVDALKLATTHAGNGRIFNIGSGEGRSLNEIVASISRLLAEEIKIERHPSRRVDVPMSILDNEFAARELNWRPRVSFEKGLAFTISWMKSISMT